MHTGLRATALLFFFSGCHGMDWDHRRDDCDRHRWDPPTDPSRPNGRGGGRPPGGQTPGNGTGGATGTRPDAAAADGQAPSPIVPASTGYCASNAMCGSDLVCDRTLGACATPRGGCGTAAFQPTRTVGEMVLMLDRSNSMSERTPTGSKWSDLVGSIASVLERRGEVAWGLSLFPSSDVQACVTAPLLITPAGGTAGAISAAIAGSGPTGSGTPTRKALLEAGNAILGSTRPTRKYLLLATDGEPNCAPGATDLVGSDLAGSTHAIQSLAEQGATTFVLGVAVHGEAAAALSAMAKAGGHARSGATAYYTAADATELERALHEVARQIALCTFELTPPPPAGTTLTLSIGGRSFARNPSHVGDGWDVTGAGRAIELYGAACDAVQTGAAIELSYACGTGSRCDPSALACVPVGLP